MDFLDIDYLASGNEKQKKAYAVLQKYAVMERLRNYDPILVGTIPIGIDVDNSDLDIVCCWKNKAEFVEKMQREFPGEKDFFLWEKPALGNESIVCSFFLDDFEIEVFGQDIATNEQNAYRHMLVEYKILQQKGESFRRQIIRLKQQGIKTEPAFAKLLGIEGDPYLGLLEYEI